MPGRRSRGRVGGIPRTPSLGRLCDGALWRDGRACDALCWLAEAALNASRYGAVCDGGLGRSSGGYHTAECSRVKPPTENIPTGDYCLPMIMGNFHNANSRKLRRPAVITGRELLPNLRGGRVYRNSDHRRKLRHAHNSTPHRMSPVDLAAASPPL